MWSTRSSAVSGSPAHEGDTAWVTVGGCGPAPATGLDGRGWQCPIHRRGRCRQAGPQPAVGDGDDGQGYKKPGPVASSTGDAGRGRSMLGSCPLSLNLLRPQGCDLHWSSFSGTPGWRIIPVELRGVVNLPVAVPANLLHDRVSAAGVGGALLRVGPLEPALLLRRVALPPGVRRLVVAAGAGAGGDPRR